MNTQKARDVSTQTAIQRDAVIEVATAVYESLLGDLAVTVDDATSGDRVHASVSIRGAWHGSVEVRIAPALATRLAREVLQSNPSSTDDPDVRDVVGEVANMIGGNLKALLPEPCALSLPVVERVARCVHPDLAQAFVLGNDAFEVVVAEERAP